MAHRKKIGCMIDFEVEKITVRVKSRKIKTPKNFKIPELIIIPCRVVNISGTSILLKRVKNVN